jgi:hypothetical protein
LWSGLLRAVHGSKRLRDETRRLGRLDQGAVNPDRRAGDQRQGERIAWPGIDLGAGRWAVHHDDHEVGLVAEPVDADLPQAPSKGLDRPDGEVMGKRASQLRAQEAKGKVGGFLSRTRRRSATRMSRNPCCVAVDMTASSPDARP